MRLSLIICVLCWALSVSPASAQQPITLDRIMADPDWIGRAPEQPLWSPDGKQVYFRRKAKGSDVLRWWVVAVDAGRPQKLSWKEVSKSLPKRGDMNQARSHQVFEFGGDVFVRDLHTHQVRQLTRTAAFESAPAFLRDGRRVRFFRDNTLFVRHIKSGLEFEAAVLRFEDEPKEEPAKRFVASKEQELFEYLKNRKLRSETSRDSRRKANRVNRFHVGEPFYLGKQNELRRQVISPDGRWMAIVTSPRVPSRGGRADKMPVWVLNDGYADSRDVRTLVGDSAEPHESLLLLDLARHRQFSVPLDLPGRNDDPLEFIREQEADKASPDGDEAAPIKAKQESSEESSEKTGSPRDLTIRSLAFSEDSTRLLFQCFSTDNKDRWTCTLVTDEDGTNAKVVEHRHDPAWINWTRYPVDWLGDTHQLYFVSEQSGYAQLYLADSNTGSVTALTKGQFEVSSVQESQDGKRLFFRSNATHPGVYELSVVEIETGDIRQLSKLGGLNTFVISPDEQSTVALHSTLAEPPSLVYFDVQSDTPPRTLADFTTKAFRAVPWSIPEIVRVPTRHGRPIYARLYRPQGEPEGPRPAVVFVHGAGYLQNAHYGWSGYFREFMFHSLLTERGYLVLDMDYRASKGYGRDWRTAIYRQMGTPELEDLEDGVAWLAEHHGVDANRVGIYGGSYGGFMTLMALFKRPGLFACGAALRPVTDWAHYNHNYTSNILNTPADDPLAYERSSPIYFAAGLQDPLLICHGMVDDNVFFKDTVRLTQKLIELEKQNWEVAMYPVEPHGFRQPSSWLDEYRRILRLFETHLGTP